MMMNVIFPTLIFILPVYLNIFIINIIYLNYTTYSTFTYLLFTNDEVCYRLIGVHITLKMIN